MQITLQEISSLPAFNLLYLSNLKKVYLKSVEYLSLSHCFTPFQNNLYIIQFILVFLTPSPCQVLDPGLKMLVPSSFSFSLPGTDHLDPGSGPENVGMRPDHTGTRPENVCMQPDHTGTRPHDAGMRPDKAGTTTSWIFIK